MVFCSVACLHESTWMVIYFMIMHTYDRYEHLYAHNCNMGSHSLLQQSMGLFKNQNFHSLSPKSMLVWFRCSGKIFLCMHLATAEKYIVPSHYKIKFKNKTPSITVLWIYHIHMQGASNFHLLYPYPL